MNELCKEPWVIEIVAKLENEASLSFETSHVILMKSC